MSVRLVAKEKCEPKIHYLSLLVIFNSCIWEVTSFTNNIDDWTPQNTSNFGFPQEYEESNELW